MSDHESVTSTYRHQRRSREYVNATAEERGYSKGAAFDAIVDEHRAARHARLYRLTRPEGADVQAARADGAAPTLCWEIQLLPAGPDSRMLVIFTDLDGEVSSQSQRESSVVRDGRTGAAVSPIPDGPEWYAAEALIRDIVARWEATRLLNAIHTAPDTPSVDISHHARASA